MEKFIKNMVNFINPNRDYTIGLCSFQVKQQAIQDIPKPEISAKSSLNFGLLHNK